MNTINNARRKPSKFKYFMYQIVGRVGTVAFFLALGYFFMKSPLKDGFLYILEYIHYYIELFFYNVGHFFSGASDLPSQPIEY